MKVIVCVVVALVAGVSLGVAGTWYEFGGVQARFEPNNGEVDPMLKELEQKNMDKLLPETPGARVQVVNGETFDFGQMERTGSMTHDFIFKNIGTAPLRLDNGTTSCAACTITKLDKHELQPGETATVSLKWTAFQMEPDYHKEAYIPTSDPDHRTVRLVVKGKVVVTMRMSPPDLKLKTITAGEGTSSPVYLWNFRDEPLQIQPAEFSDPVSAPFFEITQTPVTAEQLGNSQGASSGLVLTVTVKPGLPLGPITQTIRFKTNVKGMELLELPVTGNVLGDLTFLRGRNFDPEIGILKLNSVKQDLGSKTLLHIRVQGPHRHDVKLKVAKVDPDDVLKVSLGEAKELNDGAVLIYPMTIEIPPGSRAVTRLGGQDDDYGRVLIETTHPESKELAMKVKFLVEE